MISSSILILVVISNPSYFLFLLSFIADVDNRTIPVKVTAIADLTLQIDKGEIVAIVGPSGSGKSTVLRCMNLLEEPTKGEIIFEGKNITDKNNDINKTREKMGMVFQHFNHATSERLDLCV